MDGESIMTMAYDRTPLPENDQSQNGCDCQRYGIGRGQYIDEEGVRRFCYCTQGVNLRFKRDEFMRRQKEGM